MKKSFEHIGLFLVRRAVWCLAVIGVLTVFFAVGIFRIDIRLGNDSFVRTDSKVFRDTLTYEKHFGGDGVYVLVQGPQERLISQETAKIMADFAAKAPDIPHVVGAIDYVTLLNDLLGSDLALVFFSPDNAELAEAIRQEIPDEKMEAIRQNMMQSLTPEQERQLAAYSQSLLTGEQLAEAAAALGASVAPPATVPEAGGQPLSADALTPEQLDALAASRPPEQLQALMASLPPEQLQQALSSVLTPEQQEAVARYAMAILNEEQMQAMQADVMQALPPVQEWATETLRAVVFAEGGHVPEALSLLLPENGRHVLINLITAEGLDMAASEEMMASVENLVAETGLSDGLTVRLAGNHAIYSQIEGEVTGSMAFMLVLSVVLMVIVLFVIFPVRRRLISLACVLVGLVWTFGLMGWTGIPVSIATMATLPIIIGLGTDFGVQFHNRYEEEYKKSGFDTEKAVVRASRHIGPAVGIAVVLMAASFLMMLLSKSPMMQQFGLVLAFGAAISYAVEMALMFATFALLDRRGAAAAGRHREISETKLSRFLYAYSGFVRKIAVPILIVVVLLSGIGFGSDHKIETETNMLNMIPQDMEGLVNSRELQDIAGSTMFLTFLVEAEDVTDKPVVEWLALLEERIEGNYAGVESVQSVASVIGMLGLDPANADQSAIDRAVAGMPGSMLRTLVSEDRRHAALQVQIHPDVSSAGQLALLENIRLEAESIAPEGAVIAPAGMMSLAAVGVDNISANSTLIKVLGVVAIVLGLMLIYRRVKESLFTVLPIAFVLGFIPLVLILLDLDYNPLTIALSSLVLGIGTEFTVLVMERYKEERERGADGKEAIRTAIAKVGQAITASGLTVIIGFSTLMFVDFPVLREFGITTVIETTLCLLFALTILPALVIVFEGREARAKQAAERRA